MSRYKVWEGISTHYDSGDDLMNLQLFLEMCKSKYAHFFVMKMLKYGKKEQKKIIVKELEGKIAKVRKMLLAWV